MNFDDLVKQAKDAVEDRGGTDALKTDAMEVKDALGGEGSLSDRAREAAEAVKDPGAPGNDDVPAADRPPKR
jgi:hypothetical protein